MGTRALLGAADVTDEHLARMVADLLGVDDVELADVRVEEVAYDIPAITTASRHWVSGQAATPRGTEPWRMFVKHIQSWSRHPFFQYVPAEFQEMAASSVPWRTEAEVYRSDLADRLPDGLTMPRAVDVVDLDELSAAIWIEEVPVREVEWDLDRYRAGGLPARPARGEPVRRLPSPHCATSSGAWQSYARGRVAVEVVHDAHG